MLFRSLQVVASEGLSEDAGFASWGEKHRPDQGCRHRRREESRRLRVGIDGHQALRRVLRFGRFPEGPARGLTPERGFRRRQCEHPLHRHGSEGHQPEEGRPHHQREGRARRLWAAAASALSARSSRPLSCASKFSTPSWPTDAWPWPQSGICSSRGSQMWSIKRPVHSNSDQQSGGGALIVQGAGVLCPTLLRMRPGGGAQVGSTPVPRSSGRLPRRTTMREERAQGGRPFASQGARRGSV